MADTPQRSTMRSLDRAIDVLEVLEQAQTPLRLSEIARRAGLHVATTQRIVAALHARGRVEQDAAGYRTGVAMLFAAHSYLSLSPIAVAAPLILQQLADATGLTASVFVRVGFARAVVARVEGKNPLRYVLPIGQRLPLHLGAGKVLVAQMSEAEIDELLATVGDLTHAGGRTVGRDEYLAELKQIQADGWAMSIDERVVGACSIAAPVNGTSDNGSTAIQVSGPSSDPAFDDREALSLEIRQAAAALGARIP